MCMDTAFLQSTTHKFMKNLSDEEKKEYFELPVVKARLEEISKGLAEIKGNEIRYLRTAKDFERVSIDNIECAGTLEENCMEVEFGKIGAGVRVRGDKPLLKSVYWSNGKMVCPEPFVKIDIKPNEEFSWKFTYDFFKLEK